jgi:hypothetical protein
LLRKNHEFFAKNRNKISIDIVEITNKLREQFIRNSNFMKTAIEQNGAMEGYVNADSWLDVVRRQVGTLKFGVVQIVVHGARVVQIERTEKVRIVNPIVASANED